uniref:(northern house mosquito) hypothetical protein n=1 Tax=Culex pipiens TaxID=7175 RepID=A0A8D8FUZ5_CULPI
MGCLFCFVFNGNKFTGMNSFFFVHKKVQLVTAFRTTNWLIIECECIFFFYRILNFSLFMFMALEKCLQCCCFLTCLLHYHYRQIVYTCCVTLKDSQIFFFLRILGFCTWFRALIVLFYTSIPCCPKNLSYFV